MNSEQAHDLHLAWLRTIQPQWNPKLKPPAIQPPVMTLSSLSSPSSPHDSPLLTYGFSLELATIRKYEQQSQREATARHPQTSPARNHYHASPSSSSSSSAAAAAAAPLKPTRVTPTTTTTTTGSPEKPSSSDLPAGKPVAMDYLEFEHGLPPRNPWDTPESIHDTINELAHVLQLQAQPPSTSTSTSSKQPPALPPRTQAVGTTDGFLPDILAKPLAAPSSTALESPRHGSTTSHATNTTHATHANNTTNTNNSTTSHIRMSVLSMGFPTHAVDAALVVYGPQADEKMVVDYCVQLDQLVTEGYRHAEIQEAYRYVLSERAWSQEKEATTAGKHQQHQLLRVRAYLAAYRVVVELGFPHAQVCQALRETDPARKAVATVTGRTSPAAALDSKEYERWGEVAVNHLLSTTGTS